jgi:hypothetical protein
MGLISTPLAYFDINAAATLICPWGLQSFVTLSVQFVLDAIHKNIVLIAGWCFPPLAKKIRCDNL